VTIPARTLQPSGDTKRGPRYAFLIASGAVASLAIAQSPAEPIRFVPIIACVCLASMSLIGGRAALGRLHPVYWTNIAYITMFVAHPLAMEYLGGLQRPYHGGYNLRPTYSNAILCALLGVVASNLGMALGGSSSGEPKKRLRRVSFSTPLLMTLLGIAGYTIFAATAGKSLQSLVTGGLTGDNKAGSTAYLYLAPFLLVPSSLLFYVHYFETGRRHAKVSGALIIACLAVGLVPSGHRLMAIVSLSPPIILVALKKNLRVPAFPLVVLLSVAFLVLVGLRDVNSPAYHGGAWTSVEQSLSHPDIAISQTLVGADTEMIDAFALELRVVPNQLPYHHFSSITTLVAAAVPRALWPAKPPPADGVLDAYLFGVTEHDASAAFSIMGSLYYDSGWLGVLIGFFALGWSLRRLVDWFVRNRNDPLAQAIYASALPLTIVVLRGNLADTFGRALFTTFPLVVLWRLATKRKPHESSASNGTAPSG
jgi:hypothetical protein